MSNMSRLTPASKKVFLKGLVRKKTIIFLAVWTSLSLIFLFSAIKNAPLNIFLWPLSLIEIILNIDGFSFLTTTQMIIRMILRIVFALMLSWIFVYSLKTKRRRKKVLLVLVIYSLLCILGYIALLFLFAEAITNWMG